MSNEEVFAKFFDLVAVRMKQMDDLSVDEALADIAGLAMIIYGVRHSVPPQQGFVSFERKPDGHNLSTNS